MMFLMITAPTSNGELMRRFIPQILIALLLAVPAAQAQDLPNELDAKNYEPVLFPIMPIGGEQEGAYGTLWDVESFVGNRSDEPRLYAMSLRGPEKRFMDPDMVMGADLAANFNIDGSIHWIQKNRAEDYDFSSRLFELTRPENADGVEIPVVTLDETSEGAIGLLRIPFTGDHRVWIRIYDLMTVPGGRVRVSVYPFETGTTDIEALAVLEYPLDEWSYPSSETEMTPTPGFARFLLDEHVIPAVTGGSVRIEVEPLTEGMRVWAFASLTHNETQRVSFVTPQ